MTRRTIYLALATGLLATVARCGELKWFNVEVNEPRHDTEVRLHLPMPMVLAALEAVEVDELRHGKVHVCGHRHDIDWPALLERLRTAPEGEDVRIAGRDADVVATRRAGVVELRVDERGAGGEQATVRIGADFIDAVRIGPDSDLDLKPLLSRLGDARGEVVRVESADADVRIWVE